MVLSIMKSTINSFLVHNHAIKFRLVRKQQLYLILPGSWTMMKFEKSGTAVQSTIGCSELSHKHYKMLETIIIL